jgi:hypothetical protein
MWWNILPLFQTNKICSTLSKTKDKDVKADSECAKRAESTPALALASVSFASARRSKPLAKYSATT